ncbi:MAG: 1-acyl-sn-glycerol-3-phosphate acyltransferase [Rickettsiales bacterium]|nr:1-acyl-sn-glycerol-3-phosphate acyltransferase [Rickettsiales bacterium]
MALRSFLFSMLFYLASLAFSMLAMFALVLPRRAMLWMARMWSRSSLFLLRSVAGISYRVTGRENIPTGEHVIFASKHQSAWETITYQAILGNCVFMFKRELAFIPFFGLAMVKSGSIMVNRGATTRRGLEKLVARFGRALESHNVVVFPEGTRTKPGAPPAYKSGLAVIASALKEKWIVPIALDSGRYWPKRGFMKRPGTIRVRILPAIRTGSLTRLELAARIEAAIEGGMKDLQPAREKPGEHDS